MEDLMDFLEKISKAWDKVKNYFDNKENKDLIKYKVAYEDYLKRTYENYSKIKTIIYRRVPKDLYSFYECIGLEINNKQIDTAQVSNLLAEGNKLVITGIGGVGKSTLLKHLFLNTITTTNFVPVFIQLRGFNNLDDDNFESVIYQNLSEYGFRLENKYFTYSLEQGAYVFLLDGLDEVNRDKVDKVVSEIKKLSNKYFRNKFIVTSRPSEEFIGWNDFIELSAKPLTKEQALNLISKIEFDETVKSKFYDELNNRLFDTYKSFAENPLLLNIMLLTFSNNAEIPDRLNDFYDQAFTTLYNMHDATKDAYKRDIRTGLGCEDFKSVLAHICFKSYFEGEHQFTETKLKDYISKAKIKHDKLAFKIDDFKKDLTLSTCVLLKEGINYTFTHRSFQEYFAALHMRKLTDDIQQKLITGHLKESKFVRKDPFFKMLFNMQGDKFNQIILKPGIEIIKNSYEEHGFSFEFLKIMFKGIGVRRVPGTQYASFSLQIKDNYLCSILYLTYSLNGLNCRERKLKFNSEIVTNMMKRQRQNKEFYTKLDEVKAIVEEKELLEGLAWLKDQIDFAIKIYNKYTNKSVISNNVKDILEEL